MLAFEFVLLKIDFIINCIFPYLLNYGIKAIVHGLEGRRAVCGKKILCSLGRRFNLNDSFLNLYFVSIRFCLSCGVPGHSSK